MTRLLKYFSAIDVEQTKCMFNWYIMKKAGTKKIYSVST